MRPRAALALSLTVLLACVAGAIAASWQLPATDLSAPGRAVQPTTMQAVVDSAGTVTALWSADIGAGGSVQAARYVNGEWEAARDISASDTPVAVPVAAVDPSGVVTALWSKESNGDYIIQASRLSGTAWSAPENLSAPGGVAGLPAVVADGSGVVTAMWERKSGGVNTIQAARYASGSWTSVQNVATINSTSDAKPQLTVDGAGVVTAAWLTTGTSELRVTPARYTAGAWTVGAPISDAGQVANNVKLAADEAGNVTAVWEQLISGFIVQYSRFSGGTWSVAAPMVGSSGGSAYPEVVAQPSGAVTVAWYQSGGGGTEVQAARLSGGTWSATSLSDAGASADLPQLAVNAAGTVMAAWEQSDGINTVITAARYEGGAWGSNQAVSAAQGNGQVPMVALDSKGNGTVVWSQGAGGPASAQAAQFFTVPSPPRKATATPGDGSAEVTWTAPVNDAGSAITGYTVTVSPGGRTCQTAAPTTRCTFAGLANGTAYSFSITAANALGASWASTATATPRVPASGGSGAGGGASTAPLTATITASRRTVASGKRITASIRVRNTGKATATRVVACIRAPRGLSIVQKPGAKKRLRNPACFTVKTLKVGKQVTRKITLQATASRRTTRSITGTARAKGIAKVKATPRKVVVTVARR